MPTNEILHRVAKAIYTAEGHATAWDDLKGTIWADYYDKARAAIEAMREPTEAMVEEGFQEIKPDHLPSDLGDARACYRAMIDTALKGGERGGEATYPRKPEDSLLPDSPTRKALDL